MDLISEFYLFHKKKKSFHEINKVNKMKLLVILFQIKLYARKNIFEYPNYIVKKHVINTSNIFEAFGRF